MNDDETALLAESVAAGRFDFDILETGFCDLALKSIENSDGIACAAAGIGADTDDDGICGMLPDDLFLKSIEALV